MTHIFESWGRFPKVHHQDIYYVHERHLDLPRHNTSFLPYGLGRSYGDVCLNDGGALLDTHGLHHFMAFDETQGLLKCEAGVTLGDILKTFVPKGWFLPVTPGTKFVTVGGAIANDIHGKNHHRDGTFGRHVLQFELLRSDGQSQNHRMICSPTQNADYYNATIGGLGLTGLITWAEIRLKKIQSAWIEMESIRLENYKDFFRASEASDQGFEYTVAWIDNLASGENLGRGIFMRGNHSTNGSLKPHTDKKITVPFEAPNFFLNKLSLSAFNSLYYNKQLEPMVHKTVHYDPFFYPLDSVESWNLIYGSRGFFQYQCVVPDTADHKPTMELMETIAASGQGSFLTVLKKFGPLKSPGMLSFPKAGVTLALDFPNNGKKTLELMNTLDSIVKSVGGSVYPAKDARMSPETFKIYYPQWKDFAEFIDPKFSSGFWKRVTS